MNSETFRMMALFGSGADRGVQTVIEVVLKTRSREVVIPGFLLRVPFPCCVLFSICYGLLES